MLTLWTDPKPIVPGQYNDINIQANVSNSGGGYLHVSVNGTQVVNYSGPLGYGPPPIGRKDSIGMRQPRPLPPISAI